MKREYKLYNIILPIWMVFLFPQLWAVIIPGNLVIDCLVLFLTLLALKHRGKGAILPSSLKNGYSLSPLNGDHNTLFSFLVGLTLSLIHIS